jgi:hypothetical protein
MESSLGTSLPTLDPLFAIVVVALLGVLVSWAIEKLHISTVFPEAMACKNWRPLIFAGMGIDWRVNRRYC